MTERSTTGPARLRQFGERLRSLRLLEGLTQAELAERADISFEHVNKIERGAAAPSFATLCSLADALEVEPAHLFLFPRNGQSKDKDEQPGFPDGLSSSLASMGYWEHVPGQDSTAFTESLFRLLGYDPGEVEPSLELLRKHALVEDKDRLEQALQQAGQGAPLRSFEVRFLGRDGQLRHAILACKSMPGGEQALDHMCGVALDISEFKRLHDALARARAKLEGRVLERTEMLDAVSKELDDERRNIQDLRDSLIIFETLLSSTRENLCFVDTSFVFRAANESCLRLYGCKREDIVGHPVAEVLGRDIFEKTVRPMLEVCFSGKEVAFQDWVDIPGKGKRFLEVSHAPCFKEGRILGALVVKRDASKRKNYEEGLRRSKLEAESDSRNKTEFLANMGHELRLPLNGVLGMLQLMRMSMLNEEQAEYTDQAMAACRSLLTVINEILDFARIETGRAEIRTAPFDARILLAEIEEAFADQAREKGLELSLAYQPEDAALVMADGIRIRQVLFSLVSNALKFTDKGGVRVDIQLKETEAQGLMLRCAVQDSGPGIPAGDSARIFTPFYQVDGSYSRRHKGVGLGLAIAKGLALCMGGDISVENQPDGGALFTLLVPVKKACGQCLHLQPQEEACDKDNPLRVLVVEDDAVCGLASEKMLAGLGHKPLLVTSGPEALKALESESFDMVLMDVQLPGMDGLETLARIRSSETPNAGIPVAALTACAMLGERERFLAQGMNDYLAKPVDIRDLTRLLARLKASRP